MAATLLSTHQPPPTSDFRDGHRPETTAVILDESDCLDVAVVTSLIGYRPGPVSILITRQPVPPCVLGVGAGPESILMWNECQRAWTNTIVDCDRAVRALVVELRNRGLGPIEQLDCLPRWHPFRRIARREVESVVRALEQIQPDRVVIDPSHRLAAELAGAAERSRRIHAD